MPRALCWCGGRMGRKHRHPLADLEEKQAMTKTLRIDFGATVIAGLTCHEGRDHEVKPRIMMGDVRGFTCQHCHAIWSLTLLEGPFVPLPKGSGPYLARG